MNRHYYLIKPGYNISDFNKVDMNIYKIKNGDYILASSYKYNTERGLYPINFREYLKLRAEYLDSLNKHK